MKLQIGENLKRLRLERDMTQEELATMLGVSYQSVSRWENSTCYPDLELLPTIADFFGVSVDQLMGVNQALEQQRVDQYLERYQESISQGHIDDCIAIAREGVAEYPNNYVLLNKLMYALFVSGDETGNIPDWQENMRKYDQEITALGQRIMKYCTDQDIRLEATARLAFNHCEMGRKAEGRRVYETLPSQKVCRENQMWWCLDETEKLPFTREQIHTSASNLSAGLYNMTDGRLLPDARLIEVYEKMFALGDIIWDRDPSGNEFCLAQIRCEMAACYARLQETDKALEQLELAAELAHAWDHRPQSGINHSLLLGDIPWNRSDWDTADTRSCQEIMRDKWMATADFDEMRDTPAFQSLLDTLAIG